MRHAATLALAILGLSSPAAPQERPIRQVTIPTLVTVAAFSEDGRSLVAWDPAGVSSWDLERGRQSGRLAVLSKACPRAALLPRSDDGVVVGVNCKGKLLFFNAGTAQPVGEWQPPDKQIAVGFTATAGGSHVAAVMAGALGTVQIAAMKGGAPAPLRAEQEVERLAFSPAGQWLAAGTVSGVRLWSTTDTTSARTLAGGPALSFDGSGRTVAVAGDKRVILYSTADGAEIRSMDAPAGLQVRLSADGRLLAGWTNQEVVVWDTASGARRLVLRGDEFTFATFSADSTRLATLSLERRGDGTSTILAAWRVPEAR